jgi:hypothetical protein
MKSLYKKIASISMLLLLCLGSVLAYTNDENPKIITSTIHNYDGQSIFVIEVDPAGNNFDKNLTVIIDGIVMDISSFHYTSSGTVIISGNFIINESGNSKPKDAPVNIRLLVKIDPIRTITVDNICGVSDSPPPLFTDLIGFDNNANGNSFGNDNSFSQPIGSATANSLNNNINKGGKINVYPNPTVDEVNIITVDEIMFGVIQIIDMTGKIVLNVDTHNSNSHNIRFNVSQLKEGLYLMKFETNKEKYVRKLKVVR